MDKKSACALGLLVATAGLAVADELHLDYNWNALVHEGELYEPIRNVPDGFRAIGDRGIVFGYSDSIGGTSGVVSTLEGDYELNLNAGELDVLFFGMRTPDPDTELWDTEEDDDSVGTAPTWDPTGGTAVLPVVTTTFASPISMNSSSSVSFLYHATQGGGPFDLILNFTDSTSVTVSVHAPDWFANANPVPNAPAAGVESQTTLGGPLSFGDGFLAVAGNDNAVVGDPVAVFEAVISADSLLSGLGFDVSGKSLESVTFDGEPMLDHHMYIGAEVIAMLVNGNAVDIEYNWNGAVQDGELNQPITNEPSGYRSISDRALTIYQADSVGGGTFELVHSGLDYHFNPNEDEPDAVVIGTRASGFDNAEDNDVYGIVPDWDYTGGTGTITEWLSFLPDPVEIEEDTKIGLLYHASNNGGDFFVTLEFLDGSSIELILNSGDWFANFDPTVAEPDLGVESQTKLAGPLSEGDGFAAVAQVDTASPGEPLVLFEAIISVDSLLDDWGFDAAGKELDFITFDATGIGSKAVAIYAASIGDGTVTTGCNGADLAVPYGTLNVDDVLAFLGAFAAGDSAADLVPSGTLDIDDVLAFLSTFAGGCP